MSTIIDKRGNCHRKKLKNGKTFFFEVVYLDNNTATAKLVSHRRESVNLKFLKHGKLI